jgi:4-carboxymuconolactone decarboxylase
LAGTAFGGGLIAQTIDHVFGALWSRPGLSRRDRSLITVSILIALHATDELSIHFGIALHNGRIHRCSIGAKVLDGDAG